jgi:hypothetical protein
MQAHACADLSQRGELFVLAEEQANEGEVAQTLAPNHHHLQNGWSCDKQTLSAAPTTNVKKTRAIQEDKNNSQIPRRNPQPSGF